MLGLGYILEKAAVRLLKLRVLPYGPYPLIFANFVPFFFDVPCTQRFSIFGINLSDKVRWP